MRPVCSAIGMNDEQTGLIRSLTLWVLEEAARHWRALQLAGTPLVLSLNLSGRDLLDPDLATAFDAVLLREHAPAEAFCLEATERSLMEDPQRAAATLQRLAGLGFKLSIDDFGSGWSSLANLKRLPLSEIKIDRSLVTGMEGDAERARIVRASIELAHTLGLAAVAEGVETAATLELLRELRCDLAQGFHMGRPMAAGEFAQWAGRWQARRHSIATRGRPLLH